MTVTWQYTDSTNTVVATTMPDGSIVSCLVTAEPYLSSVKAGATTIAAAGPTPDQQAAAAMAKGMGLISTGTPALNGTYSLDMTAQFRVTSLATSIASGKGLPEGASTMMYLDSSKQVHVFTADQFLNFAAAMRDFVAEWTYYALGAGPLPDGSKTIP